MLRFELVDNIQSSLAADDFIIRTNLFDACTHFHADHCSFAANDSLLNWKLLTFAIGDSALRKIVRGQLDRNAVSGDDSNEVLPHLTGYMSYNLVAILEFHSKLSPWKGLDNRSSELDYFLVGCHIYN